MIRNLRNGGIVWYAPDQSYNQKQSEVLPFFDVHLSLRRVSSKIKTNAASGGTPKGTEYDLGGTVSGIGIAFGF